MRITMRALRRLSQAVFLVILLYLFLKTTYPLETIVPPDFFLRLSFLNALVNFITTGAYLPAFFPAAAVLLATVLFGRLFCGWLCPMGAVLDGSDRLFFHGRAGKPAPRLRRLRFLLLAAILLTALVGTPLLFAFDPLVILTRSLSLAFFPPFYLVWQALAARMPWMASILVTPTASVSFKESGLFLLLFCGILALGALQRRFWCRNLCPLGALLSLFSRLGRLVKRVGPSCNKCGRCVRECRMDAIPDKPESFLKGECIYCFACVKNCPTHAISFGLSGTPAAPSAAPPASKAPDLAASDAAASPAPPARPAALNRRDALFTLGGSAAWFLWGKTDFARAMPDPKLVRPPGALPEPQFLRTCIRCAGCMKVCITNGLQPTLLEAGLEGIWTPRLVPRIGACEQMCDMCSRVCPTGAIQKYALEEKERIFIGQASIDRSKCIAWNRGEQCLVCDEVCSYKAIYWRDVKDIYGPPPNKKDCGFCAIVGTLCPFHGQQSQDILKRPFVNTRKCVGCGLCENRCPVSPDPAIVVTSLGEKRNVLPHR